MAKIKTKRKYFIGVHGAKKPISFSTIKERNKMQRALRGIVTFSTWHKDVKTK